MLNRPLFLVTLVALSCFSVGLAADAHARSSAMLRLIARGANMVGMIRDSTRRLPISESYFRPALKQIIKSSINVKPLTEDDPISALKIVLGEDYKHSKLLEQLVDLSPNDFTDADSIDLYKIFTDAMKKNEIKPLWPLCGDTVHCLSSPGKFTLNMQNGTITRRLELPPEKFIRVYRTVPNRRPSECKVNSTLCVSNKEVSFEMACGDTSITVFASGKLTLSNKQGNGIITFDLE